MYIAFATYQIPLLYWGILVREKLIHWNMYQILGNTWINCEHGPWLRMRHSCGRARPLVLSETSVTFRAGLRRLGASSDTAFLALDLVREVTAKAMQYSGVWVQTDTTQLLEPCCPHTSGLTSVFWCKMWDSFSPVFVSHVGVILIAQHLTWKGDSRSFQNATVIFLIIVEGFYKETILFFTAKKKHSIQMLIGYPILYSKF